MLEYTFKNIIIDPTKEGIESLIGKEVYFHNNPSLCLDYANKKTTDHLGVLVKILKNSPIPFTIKQGDTVNEYSCIIEKKEEPYSERAKKWIEQNDLKEGDYVKVTRKVNDHEDEWQGLWLDYMDESVGKTLKVKGIYTYVYTIGLENGFYYPYFVLEKTEPLKPEYVPFKSIEEFVERYTEVKEGAEFGTFEDNLLQCGMWIKSKDDDDLSQITVIKEYGICIDTMSTIVLWENLLDDFEFIDGTPCGKLEEESNA